MTKERPSSMLAKDGSSLGESTRAQFFALAEGLRSAEWWQEMMHSCFEENAN
jgi:hypothetical protein